jgi:hypothetical protein
MGRRQNFYHCADQRHEQQIANESANPQGRVITPFGQVRRYRNHAMALSGNGIFEREHTRAIELADC